MTDDASTDTPNTPTMQNKVDRSIYVYYNPKPTIRVSLKFSK